MNGTATTCSSATAIGCSAHTSSTAAATRRWGPPGATSTSRRSVVRRPGRTRQRVTPRPRRTSGGTGTTTTRPRPRLTRSGSRCPTLEKPPSKSATQGRKRAKEGRPLRRLRAAGPFRTGAARVFRRICGTSPTEYRYEVLRQEPAIQIRGVESEKRCVLGEWSATLTLGLFQGCPSPTSDRQVTITLHSLHGLDFPC